MEKIVSMLAYFFPASLIKAKLLKKVEGKQNLPKGNFIFAVNHLSHIDWLIDGALMPPRRFTFIAQIDKMTGTKKLFRDLLYWWAGTIPVDRNDRDSKRRALDVAIGMLKRGYCLIIYPEGTRSRDGQLHDFKAGVGKLYLESGAPVVPVAHKGTYELMPPGGKFKAKKVVEVIIGKPLDFSRELEIAQKLDKGSEAYRGLCADIAKKTQAAVRELLS